jgi:GT2 family glycosyltransferase
MISSSDQLPILMERVRNNPQDFPAFMELARLFHQIGTPDAAKSICLELFRKIPADPDLATLARDLGLASPGHDPMADIETKFQNNPEVFLHDRDLVFSVLKQADPVRHADLVGHIVGEYLDEHLSDEPMQHALMQFETAYFHDLLRKSAHHDHRFRPRNFKVTCLVSTYCSAEFLRECLEDVVAQTIFPEVELIIIDACSPQNEAEVAKPFLELYDNIRYVRTPYRIGIYPAWSMGSLMASGPYITPFSTNDRLVPNAYQIMAQGLDLNPRASLVYGDSYLTDQPHQSIGTHSPSPHNGGCYRWHEINHGWLILNNGIGPHPMWRRSVHQEIGLFDRRYKAIGDQDFFLRHARRGGLLHIPHFTGMAWITPDSLSWHPTARAENFNIQFKHFKAAIPFLQQDLTDKITRIFHARFTQTVVFLNQSGHSDAAESLYLRHHAFFNS